jgi:hypothetical protein
MTPPKMIVRMAFTRSKLSGPAIYSSFGILIHNLWLFASSNNIALAYPMTGTNIIRSKPTPLHTGWTAFLSLFVSFIPSLVNCRLRFAPMFTSLWLLQQPLLSDNSRYTCKDYLPVPVGSLPHPALVFLPAVL